MPLTQCLTTSTVDDKLDPTGTSSVGIMGFPPEKASFNRLKSIDPVHIDNTERLLTRLEYIRNLVLDETDSRVTLRVFIENSLIEIISREYPEIFEGIIRLSGCGIAELENSSIIYLGKNYESRVPDTQLLNSQINKAREIFDQNPTPEKDLLGFEVRELNSNDKSNPEILEMYFNLVKTFGWSMRDVQQLLINPNNRIIACFTQEEGLKVMAGAGIAELFKFPIKLSNGETVILKGAEMTEATTNPTYRGSGIYRAISNMELLILAQMGANLVFGESNLASEGVLRVGNNQGRKLGLPVGEPNVVIENALRHHVTVGGQLESFAPTYVVQNELNKRLE